VSPLRGEKPQNRPLSKLNTGRLALRAMLPVIRSMTDQVAVPTCGTAWHATKPWLGGMAASRLRRGLR